ncbi:HD-GYP domain-containing protein [Paenibacillus sp. sgz500958]|uniref:HD-GYP domain-containing protein n=1 Tax=Paenibacillus sp. sgz500958 TaxID=3242475 RepID=UPI0036D3AAB2
MNKDNLKPTIMLVDDQWLQIQMMSDILKAYQLDNICYTLDPREAVKVFLDNRPDVVLLDLHMPYLNGFEVAQQLQAVTNKDELFIVMFTSDSDQANRIQALQHGVKDFITKPFDPLEVTLRIRNLLETKALYRQVKEQVDVLDKRVREKTQVLEESYLDLLNRLGVAAKYKDYETGMHINRISHYARALGEAAGLSRVECEMLYHASALHDIGKIGIPDHILLKKGPLTTEERTTMKNHSLIGASILSSSSSKVIQMAEIIALSHHERWDGQGYPEGISGEEISIYARITALCDVFDALVSERPYKRAWSFEEAARTIQAERGTHFDPRLTDLFLQIAPDLYAGFREEMEGML